MKIVGLTGGIGSGKTTVAKMFKTLGVPVYNSDKEAKKLMNSSKELRKSIKELFGKDAYKKKIINRTYIAEKVFSDKMLLSKLNAIVHPAVRLHFQSWAEKQIFEYVIQESALIFEQNNQDYYTKIVLVTAPENLRIARVLKRDQNQTENKIKQRMANQLPEAVKIKLADFIIENNDLEDTRLRVAAIHKVLIGTNSPCI